MNFVMHRDRTIASVHGHAIEFRKGQPTPVPAALWPEILAAGGVPENELPEPEAAPSKEPKDPAERRALILAAMEEVALQNKREAFTAGGSPHVGVLKDLLGFVIDARERDILWADFQQGKKE